MNAFYCYFLVPVAECTQALLNETTTPSLSLAARAYKKGLLFNTPYAILEIACVVGADLPPLIKNYQKYTRSGIKAELAKEDTWRQDPE